MNDAWKNEGVFTTAVDTYLKNNLTTAGASLHIGNIVASRILTRESFGSMINPAREIIDVMARPLTELSKHSGPALNTLYDAVKDPNIEGIPIKSPHISCKREVQVSDYGVIMESGYYNKHVTDNSSPMPRVWDISGYLTSCWDTDVGLVLKPSLLFQTKLLDAFAKSRRPLWFKTDENEFVVVQITSLTIERVPENMNACTVSIQVKEFVPLEIVTKTSLVRQAVFMFTH